MFQAVCANIDVQCGVVLLYGAIPMSDHPRAAVRPKRSVHWRCSITQDLVQVREPDTGISVRSSRFETSALRRVDVRVAGAAS